MIVCKQLFVVFALVDVVVSVAGAVTVRLVVVQSAGVNLLDDSVGEAEEGRSGRRLARVDDLALLFGRQLFSEAVLGQRSDGSVGVDWG